MNIDFPSRFDSRGTTATAEYDEHIRDMIEQLLLTNPGERVNRPDFGSGLLHMIFSPNSPEIAAALQFTAQAGVERWLGDVVEIQALRVTSEDSKLTLHLQYLVRRTQEIRLATIQRTI
ncbi:MAG: GPW/gp25 family protein [Blastocatellia bacterium]|nr:GPW/gp25 family protein [Blastocatellia bacterium]